MLGEGNEFVDVGLCFEQIIKSTLVLLVACPADVLDHVTFEVT